MRTSPLLGWGMLVLALAVGLACNPVELAQQAPARAPQPAKAATKAVDAGLPAGPTEEATTPEEATEPATKPPAEQSATPVKALAAKVGQRVVVGGDIALTVTGSETGKGKGERVPAEGNLYLLVHLVMENVSPTEKVWFSTGDFQIKDSTGRLSNHTTLGYLDDELEDANYAPGGKQTATIAFEVSQKQKGFHLLYEHNGQAVDVTLGQ